MKKNIFVVSLLAVAVILLMSSFAVFADNDGVTHVKSVKPKLVGASQSQLQSMGGGGISITPPVISFSYWGQGGIYNVRFYAYQLKSTRTILAFVDGVDKGDATPPSVNPKNSDSSSALIDFVDIVGYIEIYKPGVHHVEVRAYITNKIYYSYDLNFEARNFEAWTWNISAIEEDSVLIKYSIQPIFINLTAGETATITVGSFSQSAPIQTDGWNYFVEIVVPKTGYEDFIMNPRTTVEIQGYSQEFQGFYYPL